MGLTVVTHTAGNRPALLARSVASVEHNLPPGAKHLIIQTTDFNRARVDSLQLDDVVVFVDDDDVVINDSINICFNLITKADCGLVFTNERCVDVNGVVLESPQHTNIMYHQIAAHPRVAHHLAMFQPKYISESPGLITKYGTGICWMIKTEAALKGKAIHVPIAGYDWTQHTSSMTATMPISEEIFHAVTELQKDMRRWLVPGEPAAVSVFYP